jgi:diaminohydroxyphosphoribosylaminopyrimidine deaminase/5-amino-6-(5-phosphoribosylamino)uracil reductase
MVGATVVAADGVILGDGWHQQAGTPHAEIHALAAAGAAARGATLVCTLEPCAHHGRTGPCADAIIAAGIVRVVAASDDPNPLVAGRGFARLEAHGVEVVRGVGREPALRLNAPFFTAVRDGRPWVILKAGTSGDGMVARGTGERTAITSTASLRRAQRLRAEVDAIAVGAGTVLVDDPLLTVRDVFRPRPLWRVVFDRRLRLPPSARLLATADAGPLAVVTTGGAVAADPARARALESAGVRLLATDGTVADALRALAAEGIQSLLVEGGPSLHAAFLEAGMIDEVRLFVAPGVSLPGGVPALPGPGMSLAALHDLQVEPVGDDVLVRGYVHRPH